MSLLRLLTSGQSLVGLKGPPGRYKENGKGMLPKFASKENPFRISTRPETVSRPSAVCVGTPAFASENTAVEAAAGALPVAAATSGGQNRGTEASAPSRPAWRPGDEQGSGWQFSRWLASWFSWGSGRKAPAGIPRFGKPMVQTELSLESVKVVRNDLSESDMEVVSAKVVETRAEPAPVMEPAATTENEGWLEPDAEPVARGGQTVN